MATFSEVAITGYGIVRFTPLPADDDGPAVVRVGLPSVSHGAPLGDPSRWVLDLDPHEALAVAQFLLAAARKVLT